MAKTTVTTITDDLDGSTDAQTITFGLDGVAYSIDLGPKNEKKLRDALVPFIERAVPAAWFGDALAPPSATSETSTSPTCGSGRQRTRSRCRSAAGFRVPWSTNIGLPAGADDRPPTVARLIFSAITSLDGLIADEHGNFAWAEPDEEVHRFVNDQERPIGTYLYGRRLYETMAVWDTDDWMAGEPAVVTDYAQLWRAAEKIVYSSTLDEVWTRRTRLQRTFDADAVGQLVADATSDVGIGGANLAAHAIRAGLVDEYRLLVSPVIVGGGTSWLPGGTRVDLELLDERRFANGVVHVRYRTRR